MTTIYKKFEETALRFSENRALFWKEGSRWNFITYKEFLSKVNHLAFILHSDGVGVNDKIALLSENRPEWVISDLAINKIGAVSVPIHMVSKEDFIENVIRDSESRYLMLSSEAFERNRDFLVSFSYVKRCVIFGKVKNLPDDDRFFLFDDLIKTNSSFKDISWSTSDNDLASIIYTSGTTGAPKGVMLSNKNFISNALAAIGSINVFPSDKFLSVLPLSHVLERTAGSFVPIFSGASIAYIKSKEDIFADLLKMRPTIVIFVPKIFEKIYEGIFFKAKSGGILAKKIFFWSIKQDKNNWSYLLADTLVFRKIRSVFGGNLRLSISGGASLSESIIRFFDKVGIKIYEGYGLTETSPLVSVNNSGIGGRKIGTVGRAVAGVEIKISDDKEVMVRGENVMVGYWNNENATNDAINKHGWFKTGDLGFIDSDNFLSIIGRKKDIIVTSNGKNISPEKIENMLNLSPYIEQSLVVGHKKSFLGVLIVIDVDKMKLDFESITFDNKIAINNIIGREVDKINKKLPFYENIKKFVILNEPFTEKSGELTATLKLKRKVIESRRSREIEGLYK